MADGVRERQTNDQNEALRRFAHEVANRIDGALRSVTLVRRQSDASADGPTLQRAEEALVALASLAKTALRDGDTLCVSALANGRPLMEAIDLACNAVSPVCAERNIQIEVHTDDSIDGLRAGGLESVALNALWNSLEAIGRNGHITVTARADGDELSLDIRDDGTGVPLSVIEDPFEVGCSGSGRTGIGLSHARSIVDSLDGTIDLSNNANGRGATLSVRVPVRSMSSAS